MLSGRKRRAVLIWHRRAGKDKTTLNYTVMQMTRRVGAYYYFFPTYNQGKKVLWDGRDKSGFAFMDHFPAELVAGKNETEMQVKLKNGSLFQVVGTDKMDSIVGTNPVGCVFSEYALQNPLGWRLMSPILKENGGWAVFVYTPRGKNHGWDLFKRAQASPRWYTSHLTIEDTRADAESDKGSTAWLLHGYGGPVYTQTDVDEEIADGAMTETLARQEYWCEFEGALEGAYYQDAIVRMRRENRVRSLVYDPRYAVDTAWDLGVDDSTAIVFTQTLDEAPRVIDYLEDSDQGVEFYINELRQKLYAYDQHYGPHDIKVKEWGTGQTRLQVAGKLGIHFTVTPKLPLKDGIDAVRRFLARAVVDERLENYIDRLANYRREWDEKLQSFKDNPVHDWASHGADATRYRAINWWSAPKGPRALSALTDFQVIGDNPYRRLPDEAESDFDLFRD